MKVSVVGWSNLAFVLGLLALALLGVICYRNTSELVRAREAVEHSYGMLEGTEQLLSLVKDVVISQRGYLITDEERFLGPYRDAVASLKGSFTKLRELAAGNFQQQHRLNVVEELVQFRITVGWNTILMRRNKLGMSGVEAARKSVLTGEDAELIDDIRRMIVGIRDEEYAELTRRKQTADAQARTTRVTLVAGFILVMVILGLASLALRWESGQRALAQVESQKLAALVENSSDLIALADLDGRVLYVNPAGRKLAGVDGSREASAVVSGDCWRAIGLESILLEAVHQAETGGSLRFEGTLQQFRNKTPIEVDCTTFTISDPATGAPVVRACCLRDIGDRKRAEAALRESEAKLAATVREQATLLDKVTDAILVHDSHGQILYWNQGAERLYGWGAAEVIGKSVQEVLKPRAGGPEEARAAQPEWNEWAEELRHVTRDGREVVVESRRYLLHDEGGRPPSLLLMNIDVTDRKKLEVQFLRAQRLESIGTLAGGIAHDLNNVLTPILMSVKLLKKPAPEEERRRLLDVLQVSTERGAEMLKQLLSFAGGLEAPRTALRVEHVVAEVKTILEHTLPKTVEVQLAVAKELWPITGDATQLAQVLMNLCVNARDAMPQGGTLTITAGNVLVNGDYARVHLDAKPGPHVLVTVADTGTGIAPNMLHKIFDPFFSTKEQGKGTGLGLSTALSIVKAHGGFINVYSEVGKGTRFATYLPALQSQETAQAREVRRNGMQGQGELILVVDDEAFILITAKATLEANSYRVLTAADGGEALACFRRQIGNVRAVILDMMMPGMDGLATMRALQELDPQVRIIASSGLQTPGKMAEAMAAGAKTFLQKPYTDDQLLEALGRVLGAPTADDREVT
ncbi:MAG: CHASE3 domain-containing protein [Gemmataceae bacterium]|nr:CHASE3 domain-containing protein [Gemmataceae bacterium]